MPKPTILALDDEPAVRNAIERDLRAHYGGDYRIMKAASGSEALELLKRLRERNDPVALLLVDQRMPHMTGTEFLAAAASIVPEARKVLLTAYADVQAAIDAINEIGLDHYLQKPWDPPEQRLYPVLDDLLADWLAVARPPFQGMRLAGAQWSSASHDLKHFLARNQVPYQWLDVDKDSQARDMVEAITDDLSHLPVLFLPNGDPMVEPAIEDVAAHIGLQTQPIRKFYDVAIIGGGPAGLAAAVYGATEGLDCILIEKEAPGGQAGLSAKIDNYLGFPSGISGAELARRALTQARRFDVEILMPQEVADVCVKGPYRIVKMVDGSEVVCQAVIVATGAGYQQLDLPGVSELSGAGVYYAAATTEATYYKGQPMVVVGGANSAGQGAVFLSKYADPVYMIVRRPELKAATYLQKSLVDNRKIQILYETDVVEVRGKDNLEEVVLQDVNTGEQTILECPAMFIFIGVAPRTDFVANLVQRDERGFILTGPDLIRDGRRPKGWPLDRDPYPTESSVPGIFAVGDARHGTKHRVAASVGDGGIAISMVHEYLKTV